MPWPRGAATAMRTQRLSASLAMDKIKRIHEWEGCSEASSTFKRAAAQLDSEFKRQRLYLSRDEREDDEEYGVDDTCESEDDAYDSAEAMCETDDGQYESDDESGDGDGESADRSIALYPSDEDADVQPEQPTDGAPAGVVEPEGPQPEE